MKNFGDVKLNGFGINYNLSDNDNHSYEAFVYEIFKDIERKLNRMLSDYDE